MKVYVANFGLENFEWPNCLENSVVATMQDERVHPLWQAGDRAGYIEFAQKNLKTARGIMPTVPVASRWFNLGTIIVESSGDVWFHNDGNSLWWAITTEGPASIDLEPDPRALPWGSPNSFYYRKPCSRWSNHDKRGRRLDWRGLHPKSRDFFATEATLQELGSDYAAYALQLIEGGDLSPWHDRKEWKAKTQTGSRSNPVTSANARERTLATMAFNAESAAASANGQQVTRNMKIKNFGFASRRELEQYLDALLEAQDGLCAISGLTLQYVGGDDPALCCSLDRIDSNGHYEAGNLQIVCRFINKWKSDTPDEEFRRLWTLVQG